MPAPASQTSVGGSPGPKPGQRPGGPTVRQRTNARPAAKKATVNPTGQRGAGDMWKFYTEDSPGIKVGPVPVLVMSLMFIASVFILHIWGKYTRS